MLNGIINIHKEAGFTSHDVVAKMRGICRQKKIGHTGTLDPQATGVLPVCMGSATKLCDMLTDKEKEYIAESKKFAKNDSDEKNELCDTHNANVSQIAFKIEQIIKEKLQLIDEDVKMVLEDLSSGKIFNKSYCNNF